MRLYHCDRCKKKFEGDEDESTTYGFYYVTPGSSWAKYGRPYETVLCDECMQCSPEYIKAYGDTSCKCFRPKS
jgi:hypothetical protein